MTRVSNVLQLDVEVFWEYDFVYGGKVYDFVTDYGHRMDILDMLDQLDEHDELILDMDDGVWRIVVV